MKALSIKQPWASLIVLGFKPVENRDWSERYPSRHFRGRFLVHAGLGSTREEWHDALKFAHECDRSAWGEIVNRWGLEDIPRGGIIGEAEAVDFVDRHSSPWFTGPEAFVLTNARPLQFYPCKGVLGFFDVPVWTPDK